MKDITERTFAFALRILKLFRRLNENYAADKNILSTQLLKSATSIGANVEEAQSGQSRADFSAKWPLP